MMSLYGRSPYPRYSWQRPEYKGFALKASYESSLDQARWGSYLFATSFGGHCSGCFFVSHFKLGPAPFFVLCLTLCTVLAWCLLFHSAHAPVFPLFIILSRCVFPLVILFYTLTRGLSFHRSQGTAGATDFLKRKR